MPGISAGPHVEPASLAISAPAMTRELSGGHSHLKRLGNVRRNSPASSGVDQSLPSPTRAGNGNDSDDPQDTEQTVRQLTETLEALRQENEQVEQQIVEEDAEYEASRATFMKERDHLKHALKEREEASSELRKQVAQLDRANRAAQSKKAAKEKVLQQKEGERRKMKHDILRWGREIADMGRDIQETEKEKLEIAEATDQKTIDIRRDIRDCQESMKMMEEEIRVKGVHIKGLEEERKKIGGAEDAEESRDSDRIERDYDLQWDMKLRGLQARYTTLWNTLQQVCLTCTYSAPDPLAEIARHRQRPITVRHKSSWHGGTLGVLLVLANSRPSHRQTPSLTTKPANIEGLTKVILEQVPYLRPLEAFQSAPPLSAASPVSLQLSPPVRPFSTLPTA